MRKNQGRAIRDKGNGQSKGEKALVYGTGSGLSSGKASRLED